MRLTLEQRFWRHVDKTWTGSVWCWNWTASPRCKAGYGSFRMASHQSGGKVRLAHVVAWELTNGPVPAGMCVLHRCDNPKCCNPSHLFLGTKLDNAIDRDSKGRGKLPPRLSGADCPWAKLDRNHAMAILFLKHHSTFTQKQIGDQFGISQSLVSMIYTGRAWPDLPRPPLVVSCTP